jgi:dihydrolipoamide dehydrogenase
MSIEAYELLVAAGRTLNTDASACTPSGWIRKPVPVDDSLRAQRVEEGWLYAVGDANGRNLLTHMGKYQGRVCGGVIVARARGRAEDEPHCGLARTPSAPRRSSSPIRRRARWG